MDPDQEVAPRWWTVRAAGADGVMREGFRMNEDSFSLRIMDTDSNLWSFQKRELENYERLEKSTMPSYAESLSDGELDDLVAYLFSLRREVLPNETCNSPACKRIHGCHRGRTGRSILYGNHSRIFAYNLERLVDARNEPNNWLMYSGTLDSQRYSLLDSINTDNVGQLEMKWAYQIPVIDRAETVPLVVDGIMFITEAPSNVVAVDARTGREYWRYDHEMPDDLRICCGRNNRGVAILGETLFMSTLDAHLVAIDARTGNLLWDTEVAPHDSGYSKTAAPLIVKDKVVTGIAGGEFGIRGFIDAYDPATGEREWRTYVIPGPGEFGNDTWSDDSWKTGGAATWITGSYDADLNQIYWGTGNPGPDWNGDVRLGDNLYSDSVVALDGDSGEIVWHFQFTPHDVHDYDSIQVPILADIEFNGRQRHVMMWANRNGFYYTLDRSNGEFLIGKPYAAQTWAQGLIR